MGAIEEHWSDDMTCPACRQNEEAFPSDRCYDWMIGTGSSHARDRASFTTYRRLNCLNVGLEGSTPVFGIETIELEVVRSRKDPGINISALDNILHVPERSLQRFQSMNSRLRATFQELRCTRR